MPRVRKDVNIMLLRKKVMNIDMQIEAWRLSANFKANGFKVGEVVIDSMNRRGVVIAHALNRLWCVIYLPPKYAYSGVYGDNIMTAYYGNIRKVRPCQG